MSIIQQPKPPQAMLVGCYFLLKQQVLIDRLRFEGAA
jgi:hypothetical protein